MAVLCNKLHVQLQTTILLSRDAIQARPMLKWNYITKLTLNLKAIIRYHQYRNITLLVVFCPTVYIISAGFW